MSTTSKNALRIGGALIVIALLLVCGPLSDRFGGRDGGDDEPPAVAAGPPLDPSGSVEAAAAGGVLGQMIDEPRPGAAVDAGDDALPAVVAGAAVAGATAGALAADPGSGGGSPQAAAPPPPPPVSAAGPDTDVASPTAEAAPEVVDPVAEFDAYPPMTLDPVNEDFPLPVNAVGGGGPIGPFEVAQHNDPRPCQSGGSGCNETATLRLGGGGVTPFGGGNPRGGGAPAP